MDFSPTIKKKLKRYKEFYSRPSAGQILITIAPYTYVLPQRTGEKKRPKPTWNPHEDAELMAETAVSNQRYFIEHTREIGSDYIPAVGPSYGIGLYSAFFSDAPIIPGTGTTWVHPVLGNPEDIDTLRFDPANRWVSFMRRFMQRAVELWQGDFCVCMPNSFAPSDLANALRGNALFYDLYDAPEQVDRMLSACADATLALYRELKPHTLAPDGGFCAAGLWMPGNGLFLSEDASDLCSPTQYRRYFLPQTQRIIDGIGGAYIHHHALGWKVHGEIAKLTNLRFLEISWDPNCPRPVDHLDELLELSLTTPLQIRCTLSDLKNRFEQMRQGRIAVMVNVDTIEEAKEAVRLVRRHSVM